jgi:NAD-dependent DNA ligase
MSDDAFYNRVGGDRIASRQIDELIGIARGLLADGGISRDEVEYLEKWLAANLDISDQPVIHALYTRIEEILSDNLVDEDEKAELFDTLAKLTNRDFELGETLKATTLPIDDPPPSLTFAGKRYCFTGTFLYGLRKRCEQAVAVRGATFGPICQQTNVLVIGTYATDSWKHSSFGNKIIAAVSMRGRGFPIAIVSERHWTQYL